MHHSPICPLPSPPIPEGVFHLETTYGTVQTARREEENSHKHDKHDNHGSFIASYML
jgi:hypothetical protein